MNGVTSRGWMGRAVLAAAAVCVGLAPAGAITRTVSTVSQLNTAMTSYNSGDEIVILPGTYNLTTGFYLNRAPNLVIRGATGNRDDVVLFGGGMNNTSAIRECIQLVRDDITVKDLTISGFYHHAIHYQPNIYRPIISNVHTLNIGCQHIKGAKYNYDGIIEQSLLEQTQVRQNGLPDRPDNYVGGIDLHGGVNFQIRDNVVMRIHGAAGGDGGIFLWNDSRNPTIERNVVVGCSKGIELGNFSGSGQGAYNVSGGIVRNNFVIREYNNDLGMEFWYTRDIKVYNNTVYSVDPNDPDAFRTVSIGGNATYPTVNFILADNIIRGDLKLFAYGDHTELNNIITRSVPADWFADPDNFNLHLTELAALAIGQGVSLAEVLEDFDRQLRPYGGFPDIGADEWRLAGDLDLDLDVDFSDYQTLEANFGRTGVGWAQGDMDFDGDVDFADYQALENNFGRVLNAASVPEPCMLLLLGAGALALRRRK